MNPLLAIAEGTVKRGDEIGFNKGSNRWRKYIWDTCDICHKGRWVIFIHKGPKHTVCNSCSNKRDHGRLRNPLNPHPTFTKGDNGLFTSETARCSPLRLEEACGGCGCLAAYEPLEEWKGGWYCSDCLKRRKANIPPQGIVFPI